MFSWIRTLWYIAVGAALFWKPRQCLMVGPDFPPIEGEWIVLILVTIMVTGFCAILWPRLRVDRPQWIAHRMVLGIWLLGPLSLSYHPSHYVVGLRGPQTAEDWWRVVGATSVFPVATWRMAAADGSLAAVLAASVALVLLALWVERGQPWWRRTLCRTRRQRPVPTAYFTQDEATGRWTAIPTVSVWSEEVVPARAPVGLGSEVSTECGATW
jgi:hypothetical protein